MSRRLCAQVDIRAAPERVWEVLTDLAAHPRWNPFIVAAEGIVGPGRRLTLRMQPVGGRTMTLRPRIVEAAPGRELRWRGRLVLPGLMDAEHGFVLQPQEGGTRLVQEETSRGVLVPMVAASLDPGHAARLRGDERGAEEAGGGAGAHAGRYGIGDGVRRRSVLQASACTGAAAVAGNAFIGTPAMPATRPETGPSPVDGAPAPASSACARSWSLSWRSGERSQGIHARVVPWRRTPPTSSSTTCRGRTGCGG
ncbi:SRPBCC domain-containing protein [Geodermatophilus saharensis]|uniref:SRPBCC domain-containing protein n=1 Tax=Geodermatophilus saharensis TaxID=1137994 RepID=UPI001595962A|nr:SRPBCC domain-containing protein [Geodermatophilus saharensis]